MSPRAYCSIIISCGCWPSRTASDLGSQLGKITFATHHQIYDLAIQTVQKKQHPILSQMTRVQSCQSWEHDTYHLVVKKFPVASVVGWHDWQSESLLPSRVYPGNPVYGPIEGSSSIGRLCDPRMGSSSVIITDLQHATVTYNYH